MTAAEPAEDRPTDGPDRREDPIAADRVAGTARQIASPKPSVAAGWDREANLEKDPAIVPDPAETPVPPELREQIEAAMGRYPEPRSAVIPALHAAQDRYGWLSPQALEEVGAVMQVTPAYLASIASFYDMFNQEPVGRHYVYVCTGVACHLSNPYPVYKAISEARKWLEFDDVQVREFECLGACEMAPMASVDGRYVGPLDPSDGPEIIMSLKEGRKPLPGRGLEDSDHMPAFAGDPPPHEEHP